MTRGGRRVPELTAGTSRKIENRRHALAEPDVYDLTWAARFDETDLDQAPEHCSRAQLSTTSNVHARRRGRFTSTMLNRLSPGTPAPVSTFQRLWVARTSSTVQ